MFEREAKQIQNCYAKNRATTNLIRLSLVLIFLTFLVNVNEVIFYLETTNFHLEFKNSLHIHKCSMMPFSEPISAKNEN